MHGGGGRWRRRIGRRRQLRASRTDSNGGERAEDAAVLAVMVDPCWEEPNDGGELGNMAAVEELEGEKNGDLDREKAGGKGRRVGEVQVGALGVVLDLQGSRWATTT